MNRDTYSYLLQVIIYFVITFAATAQEQKEVHFWIDRNENLSNEFRSLRIERPIPENYIPQLSFNMNWEKNIHELLIYNPIANTVVIEKPFVWNPNNGFTIKNRRYNYIDIVDYKPQFNKNLDIEMNYKIYRNLSLELSGYYKKSPTISPASFLQSEIQTNLSYYIAKNIKLKAGIIYGYNPVTKRWENMFMTGIAIDF